MSDECAEHDAALATRAHELAVGLEQARAQLRSALLAGADTGAIRDFIADLQGEASEVARARAEIAAELAAVEAFSIADYAARLAAEAGERIAMAAAGLQPPSPPAGLR